MSVEVLQTLSRIFLIAAIALLFLSIVFFFAFKVPSLIADITGISAKKGIAAIKMQSEHVSGSGTSGKIESGGIYKGNSENSSQKVTNSPVTTKLNTMNLTNSPQTTVLNASSNSMITSAGNDGGFLPIFEAGKEFKVLKEFSFTSSSEVIE